MTDPITVADGDDMALYGLWLGYPPCCANGFNGTHTAMTYTNDGQSFKLAGTGFVPCLACNATYTEKELAAYIAKHRLARTPFPFEPFTTPRLGNPQVKASILRRRNTRQRA